MQIRLEQLAAQLSKGLKRLYTVYGDEALLVQEALDTLREAGRKEGFTERTVHTVQGAHFDWTELLAAAQAMSLFSDRQLIEIRIPSGKPGRDGSDALQRYCDALNPDVLTLVSLPRLDKATQNSAWFQALDAHGITLRVDPIERKALPEWIAQRLQRQGQRVEDGDPGRFALQFFADRVEGNLLAAHQEIQKLALLYPQGVITAEQIESAVLNVARYDVFKLSEAVLSGQVPRVLRMLDGLQAEGEAEVLVHWTLAEDIRSLARAKQLQLDGKPLPIALKELRVWGVKEKLFERLLPRLTEGHLNALIKAAHEVDGIVKGLPHPAWPRDPWAALQRLALALAEQASLAQGGRGEKPMRMLLSAKPLPR